MMAARRTEGSGPTTQAKAMTAAMAAAAAVRRPARAITSSAKTEAARSATLKPDTAST